MKKTFKIHNFGCRTNKYESQAYADQLEDIGLIAEEDDNLVDIHIVNTCSVTQSAEKEAILKVKDLKKKSGQIYLTGCASNIFKDDFKELIVIPNSEKEELVKKIFPEADLSFNVKSFSQTRAFIKIQDGCDNFCSYCIIPLARGRSRSRKMEDILEEIKGLVKKGFKEVVITGINVGDFRDGIYSLSDLVQEVDKINGLERIRISSIHPDQVDEKLQKAIIFGSKICPSMHVSLQSGSDEVLKKMNRKYKIQDFLNLAASLKRKNNFTFTTDIIVGFPEETEEDFKKSLSLVEMMEFAKVHVFPYSKRPNTKAASLTQISPLIINERKKRLLQMAGKKAFDLRQKYLGQKMKVLLEEKHDEKYIFGHSDNFLPIKVVNENFSKNDLIEVVLFENTNNNLIGKKA
jgi:threonylcarbamoyladenosine tRNA methylthiotransferase MtaB